VYAVLCLFGSIPVKPPFTFTDDIEGEEQDVEDHEI
jgi:hypothetical protein